MLIYGVDVASYQGRPDWRRVYNSGIRFAFSKVTESTDYLNPTWAHNRAGMAALGAEFLPGAYHFLHGGDGAAQARYFLKKAGDLSGFAVALDVEASGANAATARAWVAEFKRLTGGHPVIGYYPKWYWEENGRPDLSFFDSIWQSHYVDGSGTPAALYADVPASWWDRFGGEPISILQFSSSGSVPGISGPCDVNAFRGDLDQLRALALGTDSQPQEETLKTVADLGALKAQTVPAGTRRSIAFEQEWFDAGNLHSDTGEDGTRYPSIFPAGGSAPYLWTVQVEASGEPAAVVHISRYERKTNERINDVRSSGMATVPHTFSAMLPMSGDYKYRLDVVNNGPEDLVVTRAQLMIAR